MVWIKILSTGEVRQADRHEAHALIDKGWAKLTTSPKYRKAITKPKTRDMSLTVMSVQGRVILATLKSATIASFLRTRLFNLVQELAAMYLFGVVIISAIMQL